MSAAGQLYGDGGARLFTPGHQLLHDTLQSNVELNQGRPSCSHHQVRLLKKKPHTCEQQSIHPLRWTLDNHQHFHLGDTRAKTKIDATAVPHSQPLTFLRFSQSLLLDFLPRRETKHNRVYFLQSNLSVSYFVVQHSLPIPQGKSPTAYLFHRQPTY